MEFCIFHQNLQIIMMWIYLRKYHLIFESLAHIIMHIVCVHCVTLAPEQILCKILKNV